MVQAEEQALYVLKPCLHRSLMVVMLVSRFADDLPAPESTWFVSGNKQKDKNHCLRTRTASDHKHTLVENVVSITMLRR